jgi:hypothetical protein
MSQNVHSLWPPNIKSTVMTPLTILTGQAQALALQTGGLLLAEVAEEREEGNVVLSFDLVAPSLQASRHRILKVIHDKEFVYPAYVEAELFRRIYAGSRKRADTDVAFTQVVAEVLGSSQVSSVAQSLIARANDLLSTPAQ